MRLANIPRMVLLAAVFALAGCGASSDPGPSPSPSTVPGGEGSVSVPAHGFVSVPLNTSTSGTLVLRLSLTRDIVVAGLFTSPCAGGNRSGCSPLTYTETASSDSSTTVTATGAAAGSYVLILGNVGSSSQSVRYSLSQS
jgi:hypothetical protein